MIKKAYFFIIAFVILLLSLGTGSAYWYNPVIVPFNTVVEGDNSEPVCYIQEFKYDFQNNEKYIYGDPVYYSSLDKALDIAESRADGTPTATNIKEQSISYTIVVLPGHIVSITEDHTLSCKTKKLRVEDTLKDYYMGDQLILPYAMNESKDTSAHGPRQTMAYDGSDNTSSKSKAEFSDWSGTAVTTLAINPGVTFTIETGASLIIGGARNGSTTSLQGVTNGAYCELLMGKDSLLTNNGTIVNNGFIKEGYLDNGTAKYQSNNGSRIYIPESYEESNNVLLNWEDNNDKKWGSDGSNGAILNSCIVSPVVIYDWPGGSTAVQQMMTPMTNLNSGNLASVEYLPIFFSDSFDLPNIRPTIQINYGGALIGSFQLEMNEMKFWPLVPLVSLKSGGLITLDSPDLSETPDIPLEIRFTDKEAGRTSVSNPLEDHTLRFDIYGDCSVGALNVSLGGMSVSTAYCYVPIPGNYIIDIHKGYFQVPYMVKFMPGSKLYIRNGVAAYFTADCYFYESNTVTVDGTKYTLPGYENMNIPATATVEGSLRTGSFSLLKQMNSSLDIPCILGGNFTYSYTDKNVLSQFIPQEKYGTDENSLLGTTYGPLIKKIRVPYENLGTRGPTGSVKAICFAPDLKITYSDTNGTNNNLSIETGHSYFFKNGEVSDFSYGTDIASYNDHPSFFYIDKDYEYYDPSTGKLDKDENIDYDDCSLTFNISQISSSNYSFTNTEALYVPNGCQLLISSVDEGLVNIDSIKIEYGSDYITFVESGDDIDLSSLDPSNYYNFTSLVQVLNLIYLDSSGNDHSPYMTIYYVVLQVYPISILKYLFNLDR